MASASSSILVRFFERLQRSSSRLLILDYDGTLAPFTSKRMEATPYPGVVERLDAIINTCDSALALMSGRSLTDLKKLIVLPPSVELWGCHGIERETQRGGYSKASLPRDVVEALVKGEELCEEELDNSQYEVKPTSIAVHWRSGGRQAIEEDLLPKWKVLTEESSIEIHPFDGGIELRPRGHNKGTAIKTLLSELPKNTAIAYLGDDRTDEEAFAALGPHGLKVLVRDQPRQTLADIRITPPEELIQFLDNWIHYTRR